MMSCSGEVGGPSHRLCGMEPAVALKTEPLRLQQDDMESEEQQRRMGLNSEKGTNQHGLFQFSSGNRDKGLPSMFPFRTRKVELPPMDPSLFPFRGSNPSNVSEPVGFPFITRKPNEPPLNVDMFAFQARKSELSLNENVAQESELILPFQTKKPVFSSDESLPQVDLQADLFSYQGKKSELDSNEGLQYVQSSVLSCLAGSAETVQIIPYETLKVQLNSNKEKLKGIQSNELVMFPSVTVKTELDTAENKQDLFPCETVSGDLEETPRAVQAAESVIFPFRTLKPEQSSSEEDCQVIQADIYQLVTTDLDLSKQAPKVIATTLPYQQEKSELSSGRDEPQIVQHVQNGLYSYQAVKKELVSGDKEHRVQQRILRFENLKTELEDDPEVIQHIHRSILPYQAVKTELVTVDEELQLGSPLQPERYLSETMKTEAANVTKQVDLETDLPVLGISSTREKRVVAPPLPPALQKWNADTMQKAVAAVRSGLMSSTRAAKHFNLPRTTLRRHLQPGGVVNSKMEGRDPTCQKWDADIMDQAVSIVLAGQMSSTKAAKHFNLPRTTLRRYLRTGGVIRPPPKPTEPEEFPCETCGRIFSKRSYLNSHMRTHSGEKLYNCEVCGKGLSHRDSLIMHLKTHTGERPFACEECGRCFPKRDHLTIHLRSHTGEKPFGCDVCGKKFTERFRLTNHARTHTGEKPFHCDICGRRFLQRVHLTKHYRTHTGERPYKCEVCGRCFSQGYNLRVHLRAHTGEKPFSCDVCGRKFFRRIQLTRHYRTHTGEKPYKCQICGRCFAQDSTLAVHLKTHNGQKQCKCYLCGELFADRALLASHVVMSHVTKAPSP